MKYSCIYRCTVIHDRMKPRRNRFRYNVFMFCLDLDELDAIVASIPVISRNRFNLFSFRDRDHLQLPQEEPGKRMTVKEHLLAYVDTQGVDAASVHRVMLVTNLATLGYQFNPVSFYFCFNAQDDPVCCVAEVGNTFGEMKLYFLGQQTLEGKRFNTSQTKNFYVSPFMDLDTEFHFNLGVPGPALAISINSHQKGNRIFFSRLTGERKTLTTQRVLWYALRFPLITLQIIAGIHWQALKLWAKRLRFHRKASFLELQTQVLKPHRSLTETR